MSARARAAGIDVFYPIVPDIDWLQRLVPLGVRTIQLRLKDAGETEISRQIREAVKVCREHGCQLIVNDYWQQAIALEADFVHLGQEDLEGADVAQIRAAKVRLGVSTHSTEELAIALAAKPDYVALGPVYETKLKAMKWGPQGLDKVGVWRRLIGDLPFVAIGGITPERADGVIDAGADSVAVITDFFTHSDPEGRVRSWLEWARSQRVAIG